MEEIIVLDIKYEFGGSTDVIHPVILKSDGDLVLVDCGYVGYLPQLEKAMDRVGLSCKDISTVVITHQDHDHMGALAALKQKYSGIKIVASQEEAPYINGEKKSLRLKQAEDLQVILPEEQKSFGEAFLGVLRSVKTVPVDLLVKDGDHFNWAGGCEIIATPGHTPGHISLYLKQHRTIITGDAAVLEDNKLVIANPQFTIDLEEAQKSLDQIISLPAETYICYHGGIFNRDII